MKTLFLSRTRRLCTLACCLAMPILANEPVSRKPNIVLIISDDQDNEHLGFMGNKVVRTPNIDLLANDGTVFSTCHLTASRCRPSLASLLSGRLPHQNGIYANYHKSNNRGNLDVEGEKMLDPDQSLPNLLKQAGYVTYASGKYWEGNPAAMGFTHGLTQETLRTFGDFVRNDNQEDLFSFIDDHAGKEPMFIWWAPLMPHTPHNPPEKYLKMFDPQTIPIPDYISAGDRDEFVRKERLSLAMEAWTDEEIGKLRAKITAKGEDQNTLYVFIIDNGWSNGLPAKGSVFEKGISTPVFFTWPGRIPEGIHREDLLSSLDIYPTLLSYAGVKKPFSAAGIDLREHLEKQTPVERKKLFGAIYPTEATNEGEFPEQDVYALYVRTEKWKYVYYTRDVHGDVAARPWKLHHILADAPLRNRGVENLYDLENDQYEQRDLSKLPKHEALIQDLRKEVFQWWGNTGGEPIPVSDVAANSGVTVPDDSQRLNLLFIAVDDLRPQLGCYGETWMKTPNIDRLAASGRAFKRHYVQVATCGASRHALLTGLRPAAAADYNNTPFKAHRKELAARPTESFVHLFKQNGYQTVAIGKISHYAPDTSSDLPRSWSEVIKLEGKWSGLMGAYVQPIGKDRPPFEAGNVDDESYPDGLVASEAIRTLDRLKGRPFCLSLGFFKPHLPFNSPKKYWDLYDPDKLPSVPYPRLPEGIDPGISLHPSFELVEQYRGMPKGALKTETYRRKLRHAYCAAVSYVDAQIGKVLDELDRLELSENTIVVLWGDHGWHLGDLGTWGKHTAYERALRSPLIVRLPGMSTPGQSSDALIETVDIYPTLAGLFDFSPPKGLGGDSFTELLHDAGAEGPTEALGYHRPWRNSVKPDPWGKTLRTDRYRFTVWTTERTGGEVVQTELYDHQNDPEEANNIAKENPTLVKSLMTRIKITPSSTLNGRTLQK
jgi:arylsulfatase A-like enzyme